MEFRTKKQLVPSLMLAATITFLAAMPAFAASDAEVALKLIEGTQCEYVDGKIRIPDGDVDGIIEAMEQNINSAYRGCDICDILDLTDGYYIGNDGSALIGTEGFGTIEDYQAFIDAEAESIARSIIPDGTGIGDAIRIVFEYMVSNYEYDYDIYVAAKTISGTELEYEDLNSLQGAYYALTNNSGICASLSKTFRALVEAVPFEEGTASWEAADPEYLRVAIVDNITMDKAHEWAAISLDGEWKFFDVANNIGNASKSDLRTYDGDMPYANPDMWVWYN